MSTPQQILMFADLVPLGDGQYRVVPRKPTAGVEEVNTARACELLKISRSQIWYDRDREPGASILKWRFTGPSKRRILWELPSLLAYKEATKTLGK